jgi:hypothetical protein
MSGRNLSLAERLSFIAREELHLDEIRAAAAIGIAAIERGDYITITTPRDASALRDRVNARAKKRIEATNEEHGSDTGALF